MMLADKTKDIEDFKEALEEYAKASRDETFVTIEKKLREHTCNARLVAFVSQYVSNGT
jgi:hypothetical protein